jgi:hypothetical protein
MTSEMVSALVIDTRTQEPCMHVNLFFFKWVDMGVKKYVISSCFKMGQFTIVISFYQKLEPRNPIF